jgi:dTDP-4-amino-4,6-dideoxygalactose transaminase
MALWAAGLQPGDEVITTPFTAIPTYSALRHVRVTPVFVDIDPRTYLMDLHQVKAAITAKTRAVMPVHIFGNVLDVPQLRAIVGPDVKILEDCAQAHGATLRGVQAGAMGDISAFSFYPTKNLGAYGDGGMVNSNHPAVDRFVRSRRMYGMVTPLEFVEDGINTRLDEMQAAILHVKLKHLDRMNERRREAAALYATLLDPSVITPQAPADGAVVNFHVYTVTVRDRRDELVAALEAQGIQTQVFYPRPLTKQVGYAGRPFTLPVTEDICRRVIALPMYPEIPATTVRTVAAAVNAFYAR